MHKSESLHIYTCRAFNHEVNYEHRSMAYSMPPALLNRYLFFAVHIGYPSLAIDGSFVWSESQYKLIDRLYLLSGFVPYLLNLCLLSHSGWVYYNTMVQSLPDLGTIHYLSMDDIVHRTVDN